MKNGDRVPSLIRGVWQLTDGHLRNEPAHFTDDLILNSVSQGFTTFDCADIYAGTEELLGKNRNLNHSIRIHTKYVPDLDRLHHISMRYTESIIDRSLKRLQVDCLDLVQFHWWDYDVPYYLDALEHLDRLKKAGKIRGIGLTNFDTEHLDQIVRSGFEIESIQMQISLIDRRAERSMSRLCREQNILRFGYGSLLGGFLNSRWLGVLEPSADQLLNRSLLKYKLILDDWGGWERFQTYLHLLNQLAEKYQTSIGSLAIAALLQSQQLESVIVGLSPLRYENQNRELLCALEIKLHPEDRHSLLNWSCPLEGDVYHLERQDKHKSIMRMHLNQSEYASN